MKRTMLLIALIALLVPGILLAQGDLTLEQLFNRQNDIRKRLSALETQVASTPWSDEYQLGVTLPNADITITKVGNVRSGPGTSFALIGQTRIGDVYTVIDKSGDWYHISNRGQKAWIWSGLTDNTILTVPGVSTPIPAPAGHTGPQTIEIDQTRQSYWAAPSQGVGTGAGKYAVPPGEYDYICTKTDNEYWHKISVPAAPDGWVWIRAVVIYLDEVFCEQ